jgi:hypothetical protein
LWSIGGGQATATGTNYGQITSQTATFDTGRLVKAEFEIVGYTQGQARIYLGDGNLGTYRDSTGVWTIEFRVADNPIDLWFLDKYI